MFTEWGFSLSEITMPVQIWQGTVDRNVPAGHARLQHHESTGSVLHEIEGAGHLLVIDHIGEILAALRPD